MISAELTQPIVAFPRRVPDGRETEGRCCFDAGGSRGEEEVGSIEISPPRNLAPATIGSEKKVSITPLSSGDSTHGFQKHGAIASGSTPTKTLKNIRAKNKSSW